MPKAAAPRSWCGCPSLSKCDPRSGGVACARVEVALVGQVSVGVIETADGRALAFEEVGDPGGVPIFALHGTPGCRLSGRHPDPARVHEAGLRVISYDRPGYGRSSRHRGRRAGDCVGDVVAIANELGVERFAVSGGSGGGPHALAVGARLPERVTGVGCDVGAAPYDAPD